LLLLLISIKFDKIEKKKKKKLLLLLFSPFAVGILPQFLA